MNYFRELWKKILQCALEFYLYFLSVELAKEAIALKTGVIMLKKKNPKFKPSFILHKYKKIRYRKLPHKKGDL